MISFENLTFTKPGNVHFDLLSRDRTELQSLYSHLILLRNKAK